GALWEIVKLPGHSELREEPLPVVTHPRLARHEGERPDVLAAMREGDVLVHRREGDGVRNYVHIGTGNYHSATARLYTDFGLFTVDEQIGADVADMFNYLTGYGRPLHYRRVLTAPNMLREGI